METVDGRLDSIQTSIQAIDLQMVEVMGVLMKRIEAVVRNRRHDPEGEGNNGGRNNNGGCDGGEELRSEDQVKRVQVPYFMGGGGCTE